MTQQRFFLGILFLWRVADEGTEILYGHTSFKEEILGLSFTITPFSFFQTNSLGAEVLYSTARDFIAAGADGVMVEVHNCPAEALSDGKQSLNLDEFDDFMQNIKPFINVSNKKIL